MNKIKACTVIMSALIAVSVAPVSANANNLDLETESYPEVKEYSDNTVVTVDNIEDVLDSLGVEHGEVEYDHTVDTPSYTVGELKSALSGLKNQPDHVDEDINTTEEVNTDIGPAEEESIPDSLILHQKPMLKSSGVYMKKLSYTNGVGGDYTLTHTVDAKCKGKKFVSAEGTDVTVDSNFALFTYKLGKKNLTVKWTPTVITQAYNLRVDVYAGLKYALVKVSSQTIDGKVHFNASSYL